LKQSWEIYQFYYTKIRECDTELERLLEQGVEDNEKKDGEQRPQYDNESRPVKKLNKNDPKFDIQQLAFQLSGGVDLSTIPGVGRNTILSIIAEAGLDMTAFRSAKAFASWLRLAPNNKISGGRTLSSHVPKGATPLANALRKAANVIGDLKSGGLMHFFKRIAYKKGRPAAITATAHKLAVIIWNMLTKKENYNYYNDEQYESKIRELQIQNLNKKIRALGIQAHEINFVTN
jgi:transposase